MEIIGLVVGKDYQIWDMTFELLAFFTSSALGFALNAPVLVVYRMYLNLFLSCMSSEVKKTKGLRRWCRGLSVQKLK